MRVLLPVQPKIDAILAAIIFGKLKIDIKEAVLDGLIGVLDFACANPDKVDYLYPEGMVRILRHIVGDLQCNRGHGENSASHRG